MWCFVAVVVFPQDETVDLRQLYFSVAALSGFVSFKSLLHTSFSVSTFVLSVSVFCFCCIYEFLGMKTIFFIFCNSCLTRRAEAVWVQRSCPTSWGRCWVFLSTAPLSCTGRRPNKACSLKVGVCRGFHWWGNLKYLQLSEPRTIWFKILLGTYA